MGLKITTQQLYMSRFEALIFSDYHEMKWKLAGAPQQSIDLEEAQRWMHKSEDYVLEITKNNQRLFETLASISILFQKTDRLVDLINRLYTFRTPRVAVSAGSFTQDELERWKINAVHELQKLVADEYGQPIDTLIKELASILQRTEM